MGGEGGREAWRGQLESAPSSSPPRQTAPPPAHPLHSHREPTPRSVPLLVCCLQISRLLITDITQYLVEDMVSPLGEEVAGQEARHHGVDAHVVPEHGLGPAHL